jgi:hypothetical protein
MINRYSDVDKDNEAYHKAQANAFYTASNNAITRANHMNALINRAFFRGNQWIFEDDLEMFLRDVSGTLRNRIRLKHNIIKPVVRQFIGNAIRTNFDYTAIPISRQATTRREQRLNNLLNLTDLRKEFPNFEKVLKDKFPIGETKEETEQMFNTNYVDELALAINYLIQNVMETNNFELLKILFSEGLALDGIGTLYEEEYNGDMVWSTILGKNFIFDTSAILPDLSDAIYKGHFGLYGLPNVGEVYQPNSDIMKELGNVVAARGGANALTAAPTLATGVYNLTEALGKAPIFKIFWDDYKVSKWGVFIDEDGFECLHEVEKKQGSPYTPEKIVTPTYENLKEFMKGHTTKTVIQSETRFAEFVPPEFMTNPNSHQAVSADNMLVLKYGVLQYSNNDSIYRNKAYFPYKNYCWKYDSGYIMSPVDDLIDPQRKINRLESIAEHRINNADATGSAVDKNALDGKEGSELQLREDMAQGKTILLDGQGIGVNQAIATYGKGITDEPFKLQTIIRETKAITLEGVGVNENILGTGGGYRVSSTAVNSNVQQGMLMQEDFYYSINNTWQEACNAIAKRGKMIYLKNKRKLSVKVGDNFMRAIELDSAAAIEEFRIFIKRTENSSDLISSGNDNLIFFLQNQLIDQETFSKHYGSSTPNEAMYAMRKYQAALKIAKAEQTKVQNQQAHDAAVAEQLNMQAQNVDNDLQNQRETSIEQDKIDAQLLAAVSRNQKPQQPALK